MPSLSENSCKYQGTKRQCQNAELRRQDTFPGGSFQVAENPNFEGCGPDNRKGKDQDCYCRKRWPATCGDPEEQWEQGANCYLDSPRLTRKMNKGGAYRSYKPQSQAAFNNFATGWQLAGGGQLQQYGRDGDYTDSIGRNPMLPYHQW